MKIIVDAFGGDNAPLEILKGSALAVEELGVEILLVGDREKILACAKENGISMKNMEIRVHLDTAKMYPTTSAAFLKNVSRLIIEDCQFCLDEQVGDTELGKSLQPNPCHTVGLHMSGNQNDDQIMRNVAVQGFRYGFVMGEHICADYLYVHNCEEGIVFHDAEDLRKKAYAAGVRVPVPEK